MYRKHPSLSNSRWDWWGCRGTWCRPRVRNPAAMCTGTLSETALILASCCRQVAYSGLAAPIPFLLDVACLSSLTTRCLGLEEGPETEVCRWFGGKVLSSIKNQEQNGIVHLDPHWLHLVTQGWQDSELREGRTTSRDTNWWILQLRSCCVPGRLRSLLAFLVYACWSWGFLITWSYEAS